MQPTFPTCGAFSTSKVSRLVGVGKSYLDSTLVNRTSCIYYGVNAAQATKLATTGVSYAKITYYPSLMIAVTSATKSLFGLQLNLIKQTASKEQSGVRRGQQEASAPRPTSTSTPARSAAATR